LREYAFIVLAGAAFLCARPSWPSLLVWAWCSWVLYRGLPDNRRTESKELLPDLGAANRITMLRAFLVAVAAGELKFAAPAYTAAALLDGVDGWLARRFRRQTVLGSKLDLEVDAAGILVASFGGIVLGKLPPWYAAIGLARYLFVLALALRKPARPLDPSALRRVLAGVQMGFLATALWPQVPSWLTQIAAYPFGAATLAMFVRDGLFVSSTRKRSTLFIDSSQPG
jgi:CDP-diacylglycerol--glycerol-3-phosphate 3-phosphatidyltransferase